MHKGSSICKYGDVCVNKYPMEYLKISVSIYEEKKNNFFISNGLNFKSTPMNGKK